MIVSIDSIASWKISPALRRPVSDCDSCRSAPAARAAPRSPSRRLAFWNAAAACGARTSTIRWSSSSNMPYPRLDRTITPTSVSPATIGTASIDSSRSSSVPGIVTEKGT